MKCRITNVENPLLSVEVEALGSYRILGQSNGQIRGTCLLDAAGNQLGLLAEDPDFFVGNRLDFILSADSLKFNGGADVSIEEMFISESGSQLDRTIRGNNTELLPLAAHYLLKAGKTTLYFELLR